MAFDKAGVGFLPTSGAGGLLLYSHDTDTLAQITPDSYWNQTITDIGDKQARGAMEDYVAEKQKKTGANGGVPIIITGNDATPPAKNYKATLVNGRIKIVENA